MTGSPTSPSRGVAKRRPSHPCTRCGKDFTKRSNMLIHERLHTGERPYVCRFEGCGRSYKWLSSINFHEGRCERKAFGLAITAPPQSSSTVPNSSSPGSPVTPVRAFSSELVLPSPEQMARTAGVSASHASRSSPNPRVSGRSNAKMPPPRKRIATSPVNSPNMSNTRNRFIHTPLAPAPMPRDLPPLPHPYFPVPALSSSSAMLHAPGVHPIHQQHPYIPNIQMHYSQPLPPQGIHSRMLPPTSHMHHHPPPPQPSYTMPDNTVTTIPPPSAVPSITSMPPILPAPPAQLHQTQIKSEEYAISASSNGLYSSDNNTSAPVCTVTGGVLDELTNAGYSFENDPAHSEVLLF